ncbi:MAG: NADH:flavin oxidoreductase/NADH oxidase [Fimbriimonadaceae bacterium]|nr:NADH:flavin oxidoreductase/NADH oxidase [Fimbriimonadaceae bacterium]QYK57854.1 MAG: NADH:flavin oxidoreductase/NADH oxidase [Fimbriimonadaceae bacterium]
MAALFEPLSLRGTTLRNRVALSPMCTYSCEACDGLATDWHVVHLGARAVGGCGLVMAEATAVTADGRISPQDLGIWSDDHVGPLARVAEAVRALGAVPAIQLAHAGRKAGTHRPWSPVRGYLPPGDGPGSWPFERLGPSPVPFREGAPSPVSVDPGQVVEWFVASTRRALAAGFEVVELHSAHGYLLHQFLSPLSNQRTDGYGGSFEGRTRLHRELVTAVREVWPDDRPLFMRVSATDWAEGGWTPDETVELARVLRPLGLDLMDCSSGGTLPDAVVPVGPGYQVEFAERVRRETGMSTGAVGLITEPAQAEAIVAEGRADLVFLGREMLRDPHWALRAARELGADPPWPSQYAWAVG